MVALVNADEEPFSIGLGVLSPSYSQTVGKENVKVNFEQKDNGFSYSVGDPKSGTNTYLNFGAAAGSQAINPAGYADANPSGYAGANEASYGGANPAGYGGAYAGPSSPSAYPQANPAYNGYAGYQSPSYGSSGLGASGYGSENAYGGSAGFAGHYNGPAASPVSSSGYVGDARKPEETPSQILPAGFSYHGTEGQAFLRQGDSPNFVISDERQESARGPAEQSFHNLRASGPEASGKVLVNGLVGYGPGGPRGGLPVGGYAGPQFAGLVKEHGGHSSQDIAAYSG